MTKTNTTQVLDEYPLPELAEQPPLPDHAGSISEFEYFHLPLGILLTSLPCYRRYLNTAPLKCDQSLWPNSESCFCELKKRTTQIHTLGFSFLKVSNTRNKIYATCKI